MLGCFSNLCTEIVFPRDMDFHAFCSLQTTSLLCLLHLMTSATTKSEGGKAQAGTGMQECESNGQARFARVPCYQVVFITDTVVGRKKRVVSSVACSFISVLRMGLGLKKTEYNAPWSPYRVKLSQICLYTCACIHIHSTMPFLNGIL